MEKKQYSYDYNIELTCESCGDTFIRNKYHHKKSMKNWDGRTYCKPCAMRFNSHNNKEKQRITHIEKMRGMSAEEKKQKYGHDYWKNVAGFIAQQKSKDGHSEQVRNTIERMTDAERREKYGQPGERNPMYGKPAPEGSGAGYSGWYNGIFFRSKMELSYLIFVGTDRVIPAESVFKIKYVGANGTNRTYRPDFIVDKSTIVEIKPSALVESVENTLKMDAAAKFFRDSAYEYRSVTENDFPIITFDKMWSMYNDGEITLCSHTERRIRKKYEGKEGRDSE